jgi:hypothetical protein
LKAKGSARGQQVTKREEQKENQAKSREGHRLSLFLNFFFPYSSLSPLLFFSSRPTETPESQRRDVIVREEVRG